MILFRIICVIIRETNKEISTFVLLDEAPPTTIIDNNIANKIEFDGLVEPLCYQWLNSHQKRRKIKENVGDNRYTGKFQILQN